MVDENFEKDQVSNSKFYMFRCMIAMAHADGVFCDVERSYMYAIMNHHAVPLSEEQYQTLENDMESPQQIEDLLRHINDPKYRGQLVYFARLMAYKDGDLHPNEEALLEKLHAHAVDGLDMDTIRADVAAAVAYDMSVHDAEIEKLRPRTGLFGIIDLIFRAMGIDLLRD